MEKLHIRSITYSIDLQKVGDEDYINNIKDNISRIVSRVRDEGVFIRTVRFNIVTLQGDEKIEKHNILKQIGLLEMVCENIGVRWFNISFDLNNKTDKQIKLTCGIAYEILKKYDKSFVNFLITRNNSISSNAALHCAKTILKVSKLSINGYDNFRLGVSANTSENTPFFPFSYSLKDHCMSLAIETSHLVENTIVTMGSKDLDQLRLGLVKALGNQAKIIDRVARELELDCGIEYAGQDISLSPFPDENVSVLTILKHLGLKNFGANGSLFITSYLTDILKEVISRYQLKSTGFNGVMYSLLEDSELCAANDKKHVSIDSLILYSSVCGCGLDMVPVPGNILDEELASIILDVACLSIKLNKPLGVRVLPIPHGYVNEYTQFDMDFLTNTRILQVKNINISDDVFNIETFSYLSNTSYPGVQMENIVSQQTNIKDFWDKRADKFISDESISATNLEEDPDLIKLKVEIERQKIESVINLNRADICLDLGCGLGYWSELFSHRAKSVIGIDYPEKIIAAAQQNAQKNKIDNVKYFCTIAPEFDIEEAFDFIFISGLLLYLTDNDLERLITKIDSYSKPGTSLILKEPTGLDRHVIIDEFSESLKAKYSAVYRTRNELIEPFESIGFQWQSDDDMFPDKSPLNKLKGSRLRVYSFLKL